MELVNPVTGISLGDAMIPAAVAGGVLIILFVMDAIKKSKRKK
jgi:hypothetical protein